MDVKTPSSPPARRAAVLAWLLVAAGATAGAWFLLTGPSTLGLTWLAFAFALAVLQAVRVAHRAPDSSWFAHGALLAWAAVVLGPWTVRAQDPVWTVGYEGVVDARLPATWTVHIASLVGVMLAAIVTSHGYLAPRGTPRPISWVRAWLIVAALASLYLASLNLRGRPLSSVWRLGGEFLYHERPGGVAGLYDLLPVCLTGFTLAAAGLNRRAAGGSARAAAALAGLTAIAMLGTGVRYRFFLIVVGFALIQWWWPRTTSTSRRETSRLLILLGIPLGVAGVWLAGVLARVRSGASVGGVGDVWGYAWRTLDVVGSAELLVQRGWSAGVLEGDSYRQLPELLLPRGLVAEKTFPVTQSLVDAVMTPGAGFSAPLWMEGWLNFGLVGAAAVGFIVTACIQLAVRRALAGRSALLAPLAAAAPVAPLLLYQAFSRLLSYQVLATLGALAIGMLLAALAQRAQDPDPVAFASTTRRRAG